MKLGIIGAGVIVQDFLPRLVKLEGMEVVAIQATPRDAETVDRLCRENNIPYGVYSFEELCALPIDTVYVAVPNHLHYAISMQALEKGLNVIVEKPITSNDREARELAAMAEEKNCFIFEAVTTVYFPGFEKLKTWLPEIGTVKLVYLNYSKFSRRYAAFRRGEILPAFDPNKSGGALMDLNLYNLHFVMGLFGKPQSVKYYANIERQIDTSGSLVLRYPDFVAVCSAGKDSAAPYQFVIQGTEGYISVQLPPNLLGKLTLHRTDNTEETFDDGMSKDRLIPEFEWFIDCINRGDHKAAADRMRQSIAVSTVQTKARLDAGIRFPADL